MENTYCYSFNEEEFNGSFDTKDEAIKEAEKVIEEENNGNFPSKLWIGKAVEVIPAGVNIESILEMVVNDTRANTCGDYADDYLYDVNREHEEELEEAMNDVLFNWMDKHKYKPTWFEVNDVEEVTLR